MLSGRVAKLLDVRDDPKRLVRINGAVQLVAGTMLIFGRAPRLASTALAASLIPTTYAGHPFWQESDPEKRAQQRIAFLKNCAIIGGLVVAAVDNNGAPSLRWRAKRATSTTVERATEGISNASTAAFGKRTAIGRAEKHTIDAAERAGRRARKAMKQAVRVGGKQSERAIDFGGEQLDQFGKRASKATAHAGHAISDALDRVREMSS